MTIPPHEYPRNQRLKLAMALAMVVLITGVHYATDLHDTAFHDLYRRLNYIPIVLGAFAYGLRGGLGIALLATFAYIPHAFFAMHRDPAPASQKLLEIVLYIVVGALTGFLIERQKKSHAAREAALRERDLLREQLVRAEKLGAMGELTSSLAHEIRNPLAAISGAAEALVSEFEPGHPKHEMADLLVEEIARLNDTVTDFLEFAALESGDRGEVDLASVARNVVKIARAHDPDLSVSLDAETILVNANRDRVKQVALNLVLNAIEATAGQEGQQIDLRVYYDDVDGRRFGCLAVRDNGAGVPEELRTRIFDPYFTTRVEGSGLGLSISDRIVQSHGGMLLLDGDPASTFIACFPADQ